MTELSHGSIMNWTKKDKKLGKINLEEYWKILKFSNLCSGCPWGGRLWMEEDSVNLEQMEVPLFINVVKDIDATNVVKDIDGDLII